MITIGTRIKYLGQMIGFPAASADVRISQYENDSFILCILLPRACSRSTVSARSHSKEKYKAKENCP